MTRTALEVFQIVLAGGWRRRYLIAVPAMIMPILAGGVHMIAPKAYEARMTVLVQEPARLNPFLNDLAIGTNVKDRMPALTALVKSEHILGAVLHDMGQLPENIDARTREQRVSELAGALTVQLTGSELVEIKMRAPKPDGMAKTLDAVGTRFIERLVSPERGAVEGSETFLSQQLAARREELTAAEQAYADFKAQHADKLPALYSTNVTRLAQMQQTLEEKTRQLATAEATYNDLRTRVSSLNPVVGRLEEQIVEASSTLASLRARYTDEHSEVLGAERRLRRLEQERAALLKPAGQMKDGDMERLWNMAAGSDPSGDKTSAPLLSAQMQRIQEAESVRNALKTDVEQLTKAIEDLRNQISAFAPIEQKQQQLERAITAAREMHDLLKKRYEMARLTGSLGRYEAPERIKIIDTPKEPTSPVTPGRIIFVLAGFAGGLIIGIGLSVVFEFMDPRLRRPALIEEAAGLPVIAMMPRTTDHAIV